MKITSPLHLNIATLGAQIRIRTPFSKPCHQVWYHRDFWIKIKSNIVPNFDISLPGYKHYFTATELECGGTLIYVSDNLTTEARNDLDSFFYKPKELESTFIKIVCQHKKILHRYWYNSIKPTHSFHN